MPKPLEESLQKYIQAFVPARDLKLEKISWLLQKLNNPQESFPIIHIGGTSGKGSSCIYCAKTLQHHGYKTGCFVSPYVEDVRESFLINGELGDGAILQDLLDKLAPKLEECEKTLGSKPSYFEIKFALALLYFRREKVDVAIIEVGIGGTLDATNLVDSEISLVVSVGYDHTEILGDTLQEIAENKFGIIKLGSKFVCGATEIELQQLARQRALEKQAQFYSLGDDFSYQFQENGLLDLHLPQQRLDGLKAFPRADFVGHNISCALMAASLFLQKRGQDLELQKVQKGLEGFHLPARFEIVARNPLTILDGAHNQDKLAALFEAIKQEEYSELCLVLALKKGETRNSRIYPLIAQIPKLKKIVVTSFHSSSQVISHEPEEVVQELQKCLNKIQESRIEITTCKDPREAFRHAQEQVVNSGCVLVTGSLYLVGEVRGLTKSNEK